MDDALKSVRPWVTFAGCVLVVVVLYWAQAVLVPVALAILLTFVLTPPVTWLQRWVGRAPAVLIVVTLVFSALGLAGWGLARQMNHLVEDLPELSLEHPREDRRRARRRQGRNGREAAGKPRGHQDRPRHARRAPKGTSARPVVVTSPQATGFTGFAWLGPLVGPISTAGVVVVMVIFMLLERRDLRDRLIGLFGHGQLAITTKAFDEAGNARQPAAADAVARQCDVRRRGRRRAVLPERAVPAGLGDARRGAAIHSVRRPGARGRRADPRQSCGAARAGAARSKWSALFTVLELFTNLVLETVLYAGAAGVSQVALLVSVAFWTWLWGPLGLLMATPLTVCLVVLGKHVPGLEFVLHADGRHAGARAGVRLLPAPAGARSERSGRLDRRHIKTEPPGHGVRRAASCRR